MQFYKQKQRRVQKIKIIIIYSVVITGHFFLCHWYEIDKFWSYVSQLIFKKYIYIYIKQLTERNRRMIRTRSGVTLVPTLTQTAAILQEYKTARGPRPKPRALTPHLGVNNAHYLPSPWWPARLDPYFTPILYRAVARGLGQSPSYFFSPIFPPERLRAAAKGRNTPNANVH